MSDAISLIHGALVPHPKRGVRLLFGMVFLSSGDTIFVGLKDR
tara:strand:- start:146 stop:274 length:129 start_codon:yes stop_codon:yes gene_type:complete